LLVATVGGAQAATIEVHISNAMFGQTTVVANPGETVTFVNDDAFAHDVLFEAGFGTGAPGSLGPGASWSHVFDTNGTYRFRCQTHSSNFDAGMAGKVVVGAAGPPPAKSPGFGLLGALAALAVAGARGLRRARR